MSQTQTFTLSPAVVSRIESFAAEIDEAAQQAGYLWVNASSRLDQTVLEQVRMALEGMSAPLLEALGGIEDEERELLPLSRAVPYFLPQALSHVFRAGKLVSLLAVLSRGKDEEERLALEYFAGRLEYLLETARCLKETVLEELPAVNTFVSIDYSAPIPSVRA